MKPLKVLVACECSGVVRDAFTALGHQAMSVDLQPTDSPGWHHHGDVRDVIASDDWDLMIAFPPCQYLAVSGARWWVDRQPEQKAALDFVIYLLNCNIEHVAVENPVGRISTAYRPPDQYIQPYDFGEDASKKTGLWLKNLPLLKGTRFVPPATGKYYSNQTPSGQNKLGPSPDRAKLRGKTYSGIAAAMADQWGRFVMAAKEGAK